MIAEIVGTINAVKLSNLTLLLIGVVMMGLLMTIMRNKDNTLEWYQFISTRTADGRDVADIDKLGKCVALIISSWVIILLAHQGKLDVGILFVYLAFAGAIASFSAYLRSKSDAAGTATSTTTSSTTVIVPTAPLPPVVAPLAPTVTGSAEAQVQ